jgi:hypothetical protein
MDEPVTQTPCFIHTAQPPARRWFSRFWGWMPVVVCCVLIYLLWRVFYPGMYSFDSFRQLEQAASRQFTDDHPPLISATVRLFFAAGLKPQYLMLCQCAGGLLGVFFLAYEVLRFACGDRLSAGPARWAALLVLLILLVPWSPLSFYLMTFWKDVWLLAFLCWLGGTALSLFRLGSTRLTAGFLVRLGFYLLFVVLTALSRHNAVLLLPACGILCTMFFWPVVSHRLALCAVLLPCLAYSGAKHALFTAFDVRHLERMSWVFGFELVGLCAIHPEARAALPFTSRWLAPDYRQRYYPGWIDLSLAAFNWSYLEHAEEIREEYFRAWRRFPWQMLRVKVKAFEFHFARNRCIRFMNTIHGQNDFGLVLNRRFSAWRTWLGDTMESNFDDAVLQWVFTRHGVWLVLNAVGLGVLSRWGVARRRLPALQAALLLLVPFTYYLSYLVASLAGDFRYMYPADVFMQVSVLSAIAAAVVFAVQYRSAHAYRCRQIGLCATP